MFTIFASFIIDTAYILLQYSDLKTSIQIRLFHLLLVKWMLVMPILMALSILQGHRPLYFLAGIHVCVSAKQNLCCHCKFLYLRDKVAKENAPNTRATTEKETIIPKQSCFKSSVYNINLRPEHFLSITMDSAQYKMSEYTCR